MDTLGKTRVFWNASPCGAQEDFRQRLEHRISMEPWIPDLIHEIAQRHKDIVEIGCGQGTDGIMFCSELPRNGSYRGIDYSNESIASARAAAIEAAGGVVSLRVSPSFEVGNAEALSFEDASLDCVFSNGVLHHTAYPEQAFAEVYRVLRPGGTAYITLYRKPSVKVGFAKLLRAVQHALDAVFRRERCLYSFFYGRHLPSILGTMLLECFGVPMMAWYSETEMRRIFSRFEICRLQPVGLNFHRRNVKNKGWSSWGYMWLIHLKKPASCGHVEEK
jgi:ubiquinone/menaquinone biosynthesis C-methylase UbiE